MEDAARAYAATLAFCLNWFIIRAVHPTNNHWFQWLGSTKNSTTWIYPRISYYFVMMITCFYFPLLWPPDEIFGHWRRCIINHFHYFCCNALWQTGHFSGSRTQSLLRWCDGDGQKLGLVCPRWMSRELCQVEMWNGFFVSRKGLNRTRSIRIYFSL